MEWIAAHGHEPRGAWFALEDMPPAAVSEGVCAFAQSMAQLVKSRPQAAVIFTTACDQMRRAADVVASENSSRTFLFNLPATWQTATARRLYHAEVERLGRFLMKLGGHSPTDVELDRVIKNCEVERAAIDQLLPPPSTPPNWSADSLVRELPGTDSRGQGCSRSARQVRGEGKGNVAGPNEHRIGVSQNIPLALLGGPLLPSQWSLFDAIESAGGRVVLKATEPGERSLLPPIPRRSEREPLLATLADHYFDHIVDVFQRPNSRLYDWLAPRLAERDVRGIVLWIHIGCDLWRTEAASLREVFGLPLLMLESHELHAGSLRDASRLAAFIESLQ
jgi:benzoyl-CoA reductase/2-hydroxyglutaryl-CoA dehydratase subunit BcrC/BadD/HgdB